MNKIPTPSDPIEVLGEAYELLLEKVLSVLHVHDADETELHKIVHKASQEIPQLQKMDDEERNKIQTAVHKNISSIKAK